MKVEGTKEFDAPREVVWSVINDPAKMAKTMPGVESFEIVDDTHWSAKVKVPLGLGGLKMSIAFKKLEERPPEFASLNAKGQGVGAMMNMTTSFTLSERGREDVDEVGGRRQDRRPGRLDGPARAAADHQPAGRQRARGARRGGAGGQGQCSAARARSGRQRRDAVLESAHAERQGSRCASASRSWARAASPRSRSTSARSTRA